jgi:2-C-methyl-D-erythritol 4-phosphate cytidylyltransferase
VEVIRDSLSLVRAKGLHLTDDTAACELAGHPVKLVAGAAPNPKVTVPDDLAYVELLLKREG